MITLKLAGHQGPPSSGKDDYEVMVDGEVAGTLRNHLGRKWPEHYVVFRKAPFFRRLHVRKLNANRYEVVDGEGHVYGEFHIYDSPLKGVPRKIISYDTR